MSPPSESASSLRAATRGSALARWQTDQVTSLLRGTQDDLKVESIVVTTAGDRDQRSPIAELGGKGVFVKEVQAAVLEGRADFAVHSAKDLPAETPDGLVLASIPLRADPADALVGAGLADLAAGSVVASGSRRRRVQLDAVRPGLQFVELRGNISTRLEVLDRGEADAVIVAAAALDRLGLADRITERLDVETMVPQVGQGALAVECRRDDAALRRLLETIQDAASRRCVDAERAFLTELGGDCDLPAGAHAVVVDKDVQVDGVLQGADGVVHRLSVRGPDGWVAGTTVARELRSA